ncbi:MAG: isocitrate/isopropylmalate dehydrogenase family protein [Candidatus Eisenbacteria bacterium]|uniref:Isocitrate/isopropylmalate dehydrogenase family protein n=1 Tax=Eiseniibacteriota bacterium TaxID=2212470 RepID=A0A956N8H0_UNCEI|nr:isocitrate/isopropylmalate dehydrogenase family protein [Candidatus Eisenbacteria bacterium]
MKKVTLIRGDGIGPEIVAATVRAIEATGAGIEWEEREAGLACAERHGTPLPDETLASIRERKVCLKGPLTTPVGKGYRSINVALRAEFDLFANVRPAQNLPGVDTPFQDVDLIVVRENTEGLYSGLEAWLDREQNIAESRAIVTRAGSERIIRRAFEIANARPRRRLHLVHKANILKTTSGLFLEVGREIANDFPDVDFRDVIVDACCMRLVRNPSEFDVIVTTNLFGDILSDLTAGLVGGLGVAAGANLGSEGFALFEAVHGSAPDIAGKGIANPLAVMLAGVLMLGHLGYAGEAAQLEAAVHRTLADGKVRTPDLGGDATTRTFTDAILTNL